MELVYGVLRVAELPTPHHQSAVLKLLLALHAYVTERDIGRMWVAPLDVVLDEEHALIVQPDLFFVSNERSSCATACREQAILRPPDADRDEDLA